MAPAQVADKPTPQRRSLPLPDGRRKVCPVCPVQSAPGCRHRASERHIFGRRRRRTLNLAIRTLRIGCKRVFTGRPVEFLSMRATAGALCSTSMNMSLSRRPPRGHRGVRERNRYREPLRSVDIPSSRSFSSHTPAMRWLTRNPGYRGSAQVVDKPDAPSRLFGVYRTEAESCAVHSTPPSL
jgi:hypothetical protein